MARRRLRDETWRLALARDAAALHRVADLLQESYDARRARAFAFAVEERLTDALDVLNEGLTEDWPFPSAYLGDVARIRFLVGDHTGALDALALSLRGVERSHPAVSDLAPRCVRDGAGLRRALGVALSAGTVWERAATAGAVVAARLTKGS